MRILIAHNLYQVPGGEDVVADMEAAALRDAGHMVERYTVDNDEIEGLGGAGKARLAIETIWSERRRREFRKVLRDLRPHVTHFHNTFPLLSPSVYAACRDERVPVVQTLHNYRLLCLNSSFYRDGGVCEDCLGKTPPLPGVVHACYRGSRVQSAVVAGMLTFNRLNGAYRNLVQAYIALTPFMRDKLIRGGLPPERVFVKPNFVLDPGEGQPAGEFALFVGRLFENKGVGTLLEAWGQLGGRVPLVLAGSGPLEPEARAAAARDANISVLGQVSREEVQGLLRRAAFLVFPSRWYEGFPLTPVEAMAAGLPVVASRLGAVSSIVQDGTSGWLVEPGNATELANACRAAWDERGERERRGREARTAFLANYTRDANIEQLMRIYSQASSTLM